MVQLRRSVMTSLLGCAAALAVSAPAVAQPDLDNLPPLEPVAPAIEILPADTTPADPVLATPLPPLGAADTQLPAATAATTATEAPQIRYRVELSGLKEVDLEARFRALSALLQDGRKAANAAQVGARAEEDVGLAERLLRSEGYYDAVVTAKVGPLPDADGQLRVALTSTPGARYKLGDIVVTGVTGTPSILARSALGLKTGDFIIAPIIEGAEANVALRLPEQGYPFVVVGAREILLNDTAPTGDYSLPVDAGPRARFGGFRVAGDEVFDADHIAIFPRFKPGQIYDSRKVDDLRQALVATSLFSTVAVEPVRTGTIDPDGTERVDLLVRQARGPARSLAASAGYGTGEGMKVTGSWTHRNLFSPEGAVSGTAVVGTQEQSVTGQFKRSNAGQRDRTFQTGLSVARQRFDAYNAETVNLNASLGRTSTPIWQKRWTWSVGGELIASRETQFDPDRAARDRGTYLIAALPLQLGYDRSNSLLDPTTGFRVTARVSPEAQKLTGGSFDGYGRVLVEGSAYYPATKAIVIAGRVRVGSISGAPRDDIAPSRRLYAGGGGSVRGFGYQELGPKDSNNDPLGGRSLTEFAIEARYRFGNFGIVPFLDAGRVGVGSAPSVDGLRYGAGIGARYYTNFGPMRLDVATPLGRRPGESTVAVYISIGQAF